MVSGLGRDQVLGIPVVSSCMAPPSITDIEEGVPIVARAPARPTSASKGARARDRGVFCYPSTHNSLSRQTFRSPLSRVASKPENVGVTHEHRLVVRGGSSTTSGAAGRVRQGNDGDIHGHTGPASSKLTGPVRAVAIPVAVRYIRLVQVAVLLLLLLAAAGAMLLLLLAVGAALLLLLLAVGAALLLLVAVGAALLLLLVAVGAALLLLAADGRGAALHLTESVD